MKNYEGKSAVISIGFNRVLDRKVFFDKKLYPGNTWKKAHYAIFGYYPKDFDDMTRITNMKSIDNMQEDERVRNCEDKNDLKMDLYIRTFEAIKFITGKEIVLDPLVHSKLMDKDSFGGYLTFLTYLNSALSVLEMVSNNYFTSPILGNYRKCINELNTEFYYDGFTINALVYYIYQNSNQKNPVERAAKEKANDKAKEALKEGKFTKYLNIKSKLYSDEVIKTITESFNKAVVFAFNKADKQGKDFFQVFEDAVKYGHFRLSNINEDMSKFTLENDNIIFVFCKNSVGVRLK